MLAPRIRSKRLNTRRPVAAVRSVSTGPVRIVIVNEHRDQVAAIVATVAGLVAISLGVVGVAVIW